MLFDPNARVDHFISLLANPEPSSREAPPCFADRIVAAKARGIELSKGCDETYLFEHGASYYKDFAGEGTSAYEADGLVSQMLLLEVPKLMKGGWINLGGHYDRRKGEWMSGGIGVPISELRAAVDDRIRELGLSEALVLEYFAIPHGLEHELKWRTLSFDEKMNSFREEGVNPRIDVPTKGNGIEGLS